MRLINIDMSERVISNNQTVLANACRVVCFAFSPPKRNIGTNGLRENALLFFPACQNYEMIEGKKGKNL